VFAFLPKSAKAFFSRNIPKLANCKSFFRKILTFTYTVEIFQRFKNFVIRSFLVPTMEEVALVAG